MNTSKAKKSGAKKSGAKEVSTEREYLEIRSHEVSNVRVIEGKNGDVVLFTLKVNGLTIYNCRVATGKNGDFISLPQYKGKNGKYYYIVYAAFSDEDSKKILEEIQAAIDAE